MTRRMLIGAASAAAIVFLQTAGQAATVNVNVGPGGSMSFSPNPVSINAGDTVHWIWGSASHSVTSGTAANPTADFNSGIHNPPFTFDHTFPTPGSFLYHCSFHGAPMTATVEVAAPASPTPTATATATATPTATPTPTPLLPRIGKGPVRIELQTILTGITSPMQWLPANDGTGRMFLVEQTGKIKIFNNGSLNATPFLDVTSRLVALSANYDERGLLSMAFHPGFANPSSPGYRKIYTYTSEPVAGAADFTVPIGGPFNHQAVLAEWQVSAGNADVIDPATRREVMRMDHPQSNHDGCTLAFRPSDNYLYISLGDGGAANDSGDGHNPTTGNGQDLATVLGKILRIDPLAPALTPSSSDPASANGKYRVPLSNPFVATTQPANRVAEIYALGFRNPFRFSFDAPSDTLVVGDVGQDHVEEIDLVQAAKNYGWNRKEGTFLFNSSNGNVSFDPTPDPALTDPLAQYSHDDGIAVLGGFVYRGNTVLALPGKYIFGDLVAPGSVTGRLFYLDDLNSTTIRELRIGIDERPLGLLLKGFGQDANGEIYVLADTNIGPTGTTGRILKIIPTPASPAFVNLATRMRVQTGSNVLIGGFILIGSAPKKVIVRAIGPSLTVNGQPLPGRLTDPTLTLFDSNGPLETNDE